MTRALVLALGLACTGCGRNGSWTDHGSAVLLEPGHRGMELYGWTSAPEPSRCLRIHTAEGQLSWDRATGRFRVEHGLHSLFTDCTTGDVRLFEWSAGRENYSELEPGPERDRVLERIHRHALCTVAHVGFPYGMDASYLQCTPTTISTDGRSHLGEAVVVRLVSVDGSELARIVIRARFGDASRLLEEFAIECNPGSPPASEWFRLDRVDGRIRPVRSSGQPVVTGIEWLATPPPELYRIGRG